MNEQNEIKEKIKTIKNVRVSDGYPFLPYICAFARRYEPRTMFPGCKMYSTMWSVTRDFNKKSFARYRKNSVGYSLFKVTMWPHTGLKKEMSRYGYKFRPGVGMYDPKKLKQ